MSIEDVFGIVPGVECRRPIPGLNETSFVGGGAQPIVGPGEHIVNSSSKAMSIVDSKFSRFGLVLICTKGRTEALIVFCSPKSYQYRVGLLVDCGGLIKFANHQGAIKYLRFTEQYNNLGPQVTITASMGPALSIPLSVMRAVVIKVRVIKHLVTRKALGT